MLDNILDIIKTNQSACVHACSGVFNINFDWSKQKWKKKSINILFKISIKFIYIISG